MRNRLPIASQSCITEDQKYQGALYKEKAAKNQNRKSIANTPHNNDNKALVPRPAYVEDAPEGDDAPPHVPSPPPNPPINKSESVNVFDYLVDDKSPNVSQISLAERREQMAMKKGAPSLFSESDKQLAKQEDSDHEHAAFNSDYEEHGFSYGTEPIKPSSYPANNESLASLQYKTPSAKASSRGLREKDRPNHHREDSGTSDRKRKRGHVDPLNLSATAGNSQETTIRFELEGNTLRSDGPNGVTPVGLNHSGLTGGLNRLLSDSAFPPSPDYSDEKERNGRADPASPLKRSRHTKEAADANGLGIAIKGRAGRIMSLMGAVAPIATSNEKALVKTRRRTSSSSSGQAAGGGGENGDSRDHHRPRKHHRVHRSSTNPHGTTSHPHSHRSSRSHHNPKDNIPSTSRKLKAIEYRNHSPASSDSDNASDSEDEDYRSRNKSQLVKYDSTSAALQQTRAEHFLGFVTKGPESEKGFSVNKCLKRWHRDGATGRRGGREGKEDEEKELWRGLRLRRNERGEVVLFF